MSYVVVAVAVAVAVALAMAVVVVVAVVVAVVVVVVMVAVVIAATTIFQILVCCPDFLAALRFSCHRIPTLLTCDETIIYPDEGLGLSRNMYGPASMEAASTSCKL